MSHSSLLQEIEEDLQRQKYEALWKRYGRYVIGAALAIVLGTAAVTSWRNHTLAQHQAATSGLLAIVNDKSLDKDKRAAALETFAAANPKDSQATLARFRTAAIALKDGKTAQAVEQYDHIASDTAADPLFRELANLLAVQAQMDEGDPAALQARLQPLLASEAAWRFTAKEYSAHLALRVGDKAKAKQLFDELTQADPEIPPTLAQRAKYMATWLGEGS